MWSGSSASTDIPDGWLLCDGQQIVGGSMNGANTPNLSGRFIVSIGNNGTNNYTATNQTGGADEVAITINQMPAHDHGGVTTGTGNHNHSYQHASGGEGYTALYNDNNEVYKHGSLGDFEIVNSGAHTHGVASEGAGQSHENRPSYYSLAYLIRVK